MKYQRRGIFRTDYLTDGALVLIEGRIAATIGRFLDHVLNPLQFGDSGDSSVERRRAT
ncbi:hypothetical protein GORHZ_110_00060 [Gordonia rhizosphera NBRC 16068]|uniref:Uncharacterized protein n=1 Tax=Gordonia rhizosphera NBRC 16068 TaxID=1108045 RepID=K6WVK8_9ACTN|nr:hypothetical protein GORHZ_110_00060 [Gordonia rhizosphera NBRC 16068]